MSPPSKPIAASANEGAPSKFMTAGVFGASAVLLLIPTTILSILAQQRNQPLTTNFSRPEDNTCAGSQLPLANIDCIHTEGRRLEANVTNGAVQVGPQAGGNVTEGYKGKLEVDYVPNTKNYWESSMCPVNVHWHLGTEHYSLGQYDEAGKGPQRAQDASTVPDNQKVRPGYRCHHFDKDDRRFTTEYRWEHCINMQVGETYEVHWPHSSQGACGTFNQYQTPFYDGVFCNLDAATFGTLTPQDIANNVGVQAQVFTIVNDENFFYPNLMNGWVVDKEYGQDIAYYTGSTTGTTRDNDICSQYTPITWQVDRKCHLISASSFDKLCAAMKLQRDDMSLDMHPHGSRELVVDELVANNQQRRELHEEEHDHHHHDHDGHDHHDHDHERYY